MAIRDSTTIVRSVLPITPSSGVATLDCSKSNDYSLTITENSVVNATNLTGTAGKFIKLNIITSGHTSYRLLFKNNIISRGVYYTNKTPGVHDILHFYSDGTNLIEHGNRSANIWTPASDSSCILMLEADSWGHADNTTISTSWTDYSASNRNVTVSGSPTIQTNELNGLPIVRIAGVSAEYFVIPNLSSLTSGAIYLVWKVVGALDGGNQFGTSGTAMHYPYNVGPEIYDNFGSTTRRSTTTFSSTTVWHLYYAHSRPSDWAVYQNTTAIMTDTSNTVGFNSNSWLGYNNIFIRAFDIYSCYMFNDKPSITLDRQVREYIKTKTGLAVV